MAQNDETVGKASWLEPRRQDTDARRYASMLWLHRRLIVICTLLGIALAVAYVATAPKAYTAETDLFISPVTSTGGATLPLGLITSSGNATGDVETAVRLITTIDAAKGAKAVLRLPDNPEQILSRVSAQPVAESNVVALSARGKRPGAAADLANAFAKAVIAQRTAQFRALVSSELANLDAQLLKVGRSSGDSTVLSAQLAQLRTLLGAPLPDMRISTAATPPTAATSPRVAITIVGGIVGGFAVGLILALLLELVDVKVRREDQLHSLFRLPVLGLIPREGRAHGAVGRAVSRVPILGTLVERRRIRRSVPRTPEVLSPAGLEAYRTLRATLHASRVAMPSSRSILVTSASAGEGKTTTAINLAFSLAIAGHSVILIESDMHQPSIGKAIGQEPVHDISSVLSGEVTLTDALVYSRLQSGSLRYLLARSNPELNVMTADLLLLPTAATLLSDAVRLADFVIIDAPPLAEVIDALELALLVDDVLLVVRLGQTRVPRLSRLGELLAQTGITPVGIALVGVERSHVTGTYGYGYASYATPSATETQIAEPQPSEPQAAGPQATKPQGAKPRSRPGSRGRSAAREAL